MNKRNDPAAKTSAEKIYNACCELQEGLDGLFTTEQEDLLLNAEWNDLEAALGKLAGNAANYAAQVLTEEAFTASELEAFAP